MRERYCNISGFQNSHKRFSKAIFTSACFWSLDLREDTFAMAVWMFFKSADELNFWMANLKGMEENEGFCFHRKNECSAMIVVAEQ